jgi:hypothetical protein
MEHPVLDDEEGEPCDPHLLSLCVKLEQAHQREEDFDDDDFDEDDDLEDDDEDDDEFDELGLMPGGEKQSSKRFAFRSWTKGRVAARFLAIC